MCDWGGGTCGDQRGHHAHHHAADGSTARYRQYCGSARHAPCLDGERAAPATSQPESLPQLGKMWGVRWGSLMVWKKEGEIPQGGQGGQQPRCLLLIDSWHFGGTACCCFVADTMPSSDNIETAAGCAAGENGSLWPILQGANLNCCELL